MGTRKAESKDSSAKGLPENRKTEREAAAESKAFAAAIGVRPTFPWPPARRDPATTPPAVSKPAETLLVPPVVRKALYYGMSHANLETYLGWVAEFWLGRTKAEFAARHPMIPEPVAWFHEGLNQLVQRCMRARTHDHPPVSVGVLALAVSISFERIRDDKKQTAGTDGNGETAADGPNLLSQLCNMAAVFAMGFGAGQWVARELAEHTVQVAEKVGADSSRRAKLGGPKKASASEQRFHSYLDSNYDRMRWPSRGLESLVLGELAEVIDKLIPGKKGKSTSAVTRWLRNWEKARGISRPPGPKPKR
jgi:hypothetical protein